MRRISSKFLITVANFLLKLAAKINPPKINYYKAAKELQEYYKSNWD